jgi:5-methylcytosine-specific restriction endonuclease McrBC GTP-binding regulatory subunit McrB
MAKISLFSDFNREIQEGKTKHSIVPSKAFLVMDNNELYLQIGTYGSEKRVHPNKVSQSMQIKYSELVELVKGNRELNYSSNSEKIDIALNRLIFGAPGTGKSYRISCDIKKYKLEKRYERVTFHPNYTFNQFVGSYKPVSRVIEGEKKVFYEYIPGPFLRTLVKAMKDKENNYLLVIEELNRANPAAVFGDVFQLLDRENNGESRYRISISEDIKDYLFEENLKIDTLKIPGNMYIWATMNSADQGVYHMDSAFKRRWTPEYIGINENSEGIESIKIILNGKECFWNDVRKKINEELLENKINEDKLIGAYFFSLEELKKDVKEFEKIFIDKLLVYIYEDILKNRKIDFFNENVMGISDIKKYYEEEKLFTFDLLADTILSNKEVVESLCEE